MDKQMPDYCFYKKGEKIVSLEKSDVEEAALLCDQGYEKQFEEISATTQPLALKRFAEIRRENRIDQRNFLSGAGAMPLIGVLTAIADYLFRKKQP